MRLMYEYIELLVISKLRAHMIAVISHLIQNCPIDLVGRGFRLIGKLSTNCSTTTMSQILIEFRVAKVDSRAITMYVSRQGLKCS